VIKKHGRFFWLDLRAGGHRIRRSLKTGERTLALARAHELARKLREGAAGRGVTLAEFADQYRAWARTQKPASVKTEESQLRWILAFMECRKVRLLTEVTPYLVEQMRTELLAERPRTKATINRYCQLLRGMFYRAADWGVFDGQNPLKKVKFFREAPEIKPLSRLDYEKVLAEAALISSQNRPSPVQRVFYDLIILAANTGLRRSEALGIRWKDIQDGAVIVTGKGNKRRTVPLNAAALEAIGRQPRAGEYVFDVPNRRQSNLLKRTFIRIRKRTGIHFYLHLLRHYFATSLLERGVDIVTISELLGHSKTMTSLIYSHSDPARKRRAVELLDTQGGQRPSDVITVNSRKLLN